MFADLFFIETGATFYIAFFVLTLLSVVVLGINSVIGPIALALLYIVFPVAWAMDFVSVLDQMYLIAYCIFTIFFIKLGTLIRLPGLGAGTFNGSDKLARLFFFLMALLSLVMSAYIYGLFSLYGYTKVSWTVDYRALNYAVSAVNALLLSAGFYMILKGNKKYLLFLSGVLGVYGFVIGGKGVLISVVLLYLVYYLRAKGKIRLHSFILSKEFFAITAFLSMTVVIFFGFHGSLAHFLSRFLATVDGLFILKTSKVYGENILPGSVWYYVFDFAVSKFLGVRESIGQILAARSVYIAYPEFGGPNDSAVIYILLAGGIDRLLLISLFGVFGFLLGLLDSFFKKASWRSLTLPNVLFLTPIYLFLPDLYQAAGTSFMLLARDFFLIIPVCIFLYLIVEVARRAKE